MTAAWPACNEWEDTMATSQLQLILWVLAKDTIWFTWFICIKWFIIQLAIMIPMHNAYAYLSKDKNFLFKKRIVKIFYVWNVLKSIWSIINWILILNIWHFELYDLQRLSDAAYLIGSDSL